jgi:hypothetical protein
MRFGGLRARPDLLSSLGIALGKLLIVSADAVEVFGRRRAAG